MRMWGSGASVASVRISKENQSPLDDTARSECAMGDCAGAWYVIGVLLGVIVLAKAAA
jgi:hypothetical protein